MTLCPLLCPLCCPFPRVFRELLLAAYVGSGSLSRLACSLHRLAWSLSPLVATVSLWCPTLPTTDPAAVGCGSWPTLCDEECGEKWGVCFDLMFSCVGLVWPEKRGKAAGTERAGGHKEGRGAQRGQVRGHSEGRGAQHREGRKAHRGQVSRERAGGHIYRGKAVARLGWVARFGKAGAVHTGRAQRQERYMMNTGRCSTVQYTWVLCAVHLGRCSTMQYTCVCAVRCSTHGYMQYNAVHTCRCSTHG